MIESTSVPGTESRDRIRGLKRGAQEKLGCGGYVYCLNCGNGLMS